MGAPTPQFMQQPFAANADPAYITTIPNTTVSDGRASLNLGFPPLTMEPVVSGGVPPFGQDFNGILYMLSTHAYAAQAGQLPVWSSAVAAAISGYAVGTLLSSVDGQTVWRNVTAANSSNPDADGAGWRPVSTNGIANVTGVTGGTRTVTPGEARYRTLLLGGSLTSNAAVVLPAWSGIDWLIINNTSGAFSVTVRTAGGTGVIVPQGGFPAPVGVYGDGTNIYPVVTPLTIPTATAATPDTYVLRTNAAYVLASYFNMNGAADNEALTNVIYDLGDGFLRRMSQANFRLQLFANAALTGVPTVPTAAFGTNDTTAASTAFVQSAVVGQQSKAGIVQSNGVAIALPAGWSSTRNSLGVYTVTHGTYLANTYAVGITMYNTANPPRVQWSANPGTGSFQVRCFSATDGVFSDNAFQFTLVPIA